MTDQATVVERLRPRLRGLAYRMLGSLDDADDAVQEALLRWHRADGSEIRSPEAWLVAVVTRLCVDRLRAIAGERKAYVGPWLPEPLIGGREEPPDRRVDLASDLSMAFLIVLERLAPEERAAFLLHDVFDCGYDDIARALGKSEAACRQIVHRARIRVRRDRPRFEVTKAAHDRLLRQYLDAVGTMDQARLLALFAEDATFVSDGGGKAWAARRIIRGADRIARLLLGVARKVPGRLVDRVLPVNGQPGIVTFVDGRPFAATSIETDGQRILSMFRVLNPDKLGGLAGIDGTLGDPSAVTDGHVHPSLV
ncbi:MAG TPA: RNA polymerase sigma factor SigJ [Alphaproteobacteria bacterium]|nr:RNA polymerase sigma factor SigJ [Alphaproteobacteria bacterium]